MMETLDKLQAAVAFSTVVLVLALAAIGVLWYVADKRRARYMALQDVMRVYMQKALHDRNDKVRIPAAQVQEMFDLDDVRIIPLWKGHKRRHRHPATLAPARRAKL